jgi:hypothetical protein
MLEADRMKEGELVSEGTIEFEGEKINYTWHRNGKLPNGQYGHIIKAQYDEPIEISDNGSGIESAIGLLKSELRAQRNRRKREDGSTSFEE